MDDDMLSLLRGRADARLTGRTTVGSFLADSHVARCSDLHVWRGFNLHVGRGFSPAKADLPDFARGFVEVSP
jgi:hypothetical protein